MLMHCISLVILGRLSRLPTPAVGTNWPFCVDVPLNTNQSTLMLRSSLSTYNLFQPYLVSPILVMGWSLWFLLGSTYYLATLGLYHLMVWLAEIPRLVLSVIIGYSHKMHIIYFEDSCFVGSGVFIRFKSCVFRPCPRPLFFFKFLIVSFIIHEFLSWPCLFGSESIGRRRQFI